MARQGLFREDLLYRLRTIALVVPPLRERPGDVDALVEHFVALLNERFGVRRRVAPAARQVLRQHAWPGNVRELQHAIEAAMGVCDGEEVQLEHLPPSVRAGRESPRATGDAHAGEAGFPTLDDVERAHIERVLKAMDGHRGHAARALGISERNLYRKLRQYGLLGA